MTHNHEPCEWPSSKRFPVSKSSIPVRGGDRDFSQNLFYSDLVASREVIINGARHSLSIGPAWRTDKTHNDEGLTHETSAFKFFFIYLLC